MPRTFDDTLSWSETGTELLLDTAAGWGEEEYLAPSGLPGWSRKHLVAHVAANADALSNLVRWAATGEKTPMYSSPQQRDADIEAGSRKPAAELAAWLNSSAERLAAGVAGLNDDQWNAMVVTAQGRTVPATEIPWLRSREVCVHAVDLASGIAFTDLPAGFMTALADDIVAKRGSAAGPAVVLAATDTGDRWELPGEGEPVTVDGPLADVAAYLAGRPHALTTSDGSSAPALPAWL
ncbi:maleylpyruvate isomerase family mycothiol-dependent enzyme [Microtetraspora sp. AC03309]|uniref:maleylpyruvate isomerase family mycothiol-dependent enzyme n=1 Tax=Microtetraspora sp. AC03309 TaxID=2779376 RepID=UPI001E539588|nr:maleylpyruvate isomerase family mycothiol-dependent enzyme [Microtetraspora sp. AC03309]MCC5575271.1 maleylpyruvate isomerase family mycothiol-dependent enzyme [Microtetraspora sp. AC03309]